jgi:hypothetical protein
MDESCIGDAHSMLAHRWWLLAWERYADGDTIGQECTPVTCGAMYVWRYGVFLWCELPKGHDQRLCSAYVGSLQVQWADR